MAKPLDYMPKCQISEVEALLSVLYPSYHSLDEIAVAGEYHQIWSCTVQTNGADQAAILRISGPHIPRLKTENEVAILKWLQAKTSIPVPDILAFDSSINNPLGCEYTLLERLPGVSGLDVHKRIPEHKMDAILQQLAKFHLELFQQPFPRLGGLRLNETGAVVPGPCISETQWYEPDVRRYWPASESYQSLNPSSSDGYPLYTEWIAAHMDCYIHGIKVHESLAWITKPEIELLESFVERLRDPCVSAELAIPCRLQHQDMHFGQLLIDPDSYELTGVIDWEFSQVVPLPLWRRNFLWVGQSSMAKEKMERLYERWEELVGLMDGGKAMLEAAQWPTRDHATVWDACNYLRCVVEVCPRGQQLQEAKRWLREVMSAIEKFRALET